MRTNCRRLPFLLLISNLSAQERKVDPTWLRRSRPYLSGEKTELSSETRHYKIGLTLRITEPFP